MSAKPLGKASLKVACIFLLSAIFVVRCRFGMTLFNTFDSNSLIGFQVDKGSVLLGSHMLFSPAQNLSVLYHQVERDRSDMIMWIFNRLCHDFGRLSLKDLQVEQQAHRLSEAGAALQLPTCQEAEVHLLMLADRRQAKYLSQALLPFGLALDL